MVINKLDDNTLHITETATRTITKQELLNQKAVFEQELAAINTLLENFK